MRGDKKNVLSLLQSHRFTTFLLSCTRLPRGNIFFIYKETRGHLVNRVCVHEVNGHPSRNLLVYSGALGTGSRTQSSDLATFSTHVFAVINNLIKLNLGLSGSAMKPQKAGQN